MTFFNQVSFPDFYLDAFGRHRVSEPTTLFDSKQLFDNLPLFYDDQEVSGSGTGSTHSADTAMSTLSVGATTAGVRARQTFMRFNYQPGKSQIILLTGVLDLSGGGTGITRRIGYFDEENGLFLEDAEGTIRVGIRTSTSGSAVDNMVAQSAWSKDHMDGTGPSGITLDFTKTQIFFIDFEWLGVGTVRFGFVVDGFPIYVHHAHNANQNALVYMRMPNLPVRYEIENDGTGVASTLGHISTSVISEGGSEDNGVLRYGSTAGTHVDATADGTAYAVFGLRLKSTHIGAVVKLVAASISETAGNNNVEWFIAHNPTVAGTPTWSNETNSAVQYFTGATANTVTGGTNFYGGHASSGTKGGSQFGGNLVNSLWLGSAIDGTVDELFLCVRPVGSSALDVEGGLTWRELV
jgi:hypothetical protein